MILHIYIYIIIYILYLIYIHTKNMCVPWKTCGVCWIVPCTNRSKQCVLTPAQCHGAGPSWLSFCFQIMFLSLANHTDFVHKLKHNMSVSL